MFTSIGFTELLLIGIVALIVVGPERLPGLVRTALIYIRKIKAGVVNIRDEVERELDLDDIHQYYHDSKEEITKITGFDELHESLDGLKEGSASFKEGLYGDGHHHLDDDDGEHVSDDQIDTDLVQLNDEAAPPLPDPEAESDTGIETVASEASQSQPQFQSQSKKSVTTKK